jgi:transposase InsO family protein
LTERPEIRSDNGSCYISREFGGELDEHQLRHRRTRPSCPEENGVMERANRTLGEALEDEEMSDYLQAVKVISRVVRWYNEEWLHSALGFLRPADYYRGKPDVLYSDRRKKLADARHRRREMNLKLRPPMLPLTAGENRCLA